MLERVALSTNDGIWGWDVATGRSFYSPRWWELVGLPSDYAAPHIDVFRELLHPDDRARVEAALAALIAGRSTDYREEFRLRHRSGDWRWIRSSGSAIRAADGVAFRLVGTHTDITHRIEAAERLERLVAERTRELAAARDRAEGAAVATTRFLSATSHDIRQPLQAVALLLGSLRAEVTTPAGLRTMTGIRRSLQASMELLDDLLEFSRLDAGVLRPDPRAVAVQSLLQSSLEGFAIEARERGLRFVVRDTPLLVQTDVHLAGRILRNLVSNSFKFTAQGSILVAARPRGDAVRIEVWDTGRGIAPEQQRQIFWEFTQIRPRGDGGQTRGLGLGLAIVDRLARLMRHDIGMRSVAGRGSVFWIDLPRLRGGADVPAEHAQPPEHPLDCRIAVAEDDPRIAGAYLQLLRSWGCRVVLSHSGAGLLSQIADQPPDLLVADWHLDGAMSGFELFDAVEARFGRPQPGVILSGDHDFEVLRKVNRARRRVLAKPILPDVLNAVLHAELERSRRTPQPGADG